MIFHFLQFHERKLKEPFSYEQIFLQGTVRKMLMLCLNTFYYNAINYIQTQLSHSFKILKYYSAKTQKDICSIPWSLSAKLHAGASHLCSARQELTKVISSQLENLAVLAAGLYKHPQVRKMPMELSAMVQPQRKSEAKWNEREISTGTYMGVFPHPRSFLAHQMRPSVVQTEGVVFL